MIQIIKEYPCNIREIVKKAHENGETKLAIANKGVMFSIPRFYRECVNYNIQPVIGCEFPLENGKSITLFVKDNDGYKNLMLLSSMACTTLGTFYNPKLPESFLNIYSKGLTENPEEVSSFEIDFQGPHLPGEDHEHASINLQLAVVDGFNKLISEGKIPPNKTKEYEKRLYNELDIIGKAKFENYFLIVKDYVSWAKENDCGPCFVWGSASGSLVLYCLGISDINPIENGLVFERFINPDRLSLPDINIEVPLGCREKIYQHLEEKYGKGCVSQVAALSLDGSYIGCNPHEIAISKSDLVNTVPVFINENGKLATQYSCLELEYFGPIKFDIYENVNLSIIKEVEKETEIPLNDKETFGMFSRGETDNIEGCSLPGNKKNLKLFKPDSINDLAIMYATDRPNCLDTRAIILDNKAKNTPCEPIIDCLKPILEPTYGCFVFEEQFIDAVCAFTGWDKAKADIYRKILAKRKMALREEYKKDFIESALANGHTEEECKRLIQDFDFFICSLFLKSHALEMATVIYKVGYIKCHYPELFEKLTKEFENINTSLINDCEGTYINCVRECFVENKKTQKYGELLNMRILGNNADEEATKANKTNAPFILMVINGSLVEEFKEYQSISELFKDGWHVAKMQNVTL